MEDFAKQKINNYIDEFFPMRKGEKISNPNEKILFFKDIYISRRSLKHIVEQRSINDELDANHIKLFLRRARGTLSNPEVIIKNNSKKYPRSNIFGKFDREMNKGVMVAVDCSKRKRKYVITIFRKEAKRFFKLLQKSDP